jgi:hypothetical protein
LTQVADYAALKAKQQKRFAKLYRLDRSGIRAVGDDGKLTEIAGARAVWKAAPDGVKAAKAEASVPLAAMSRVAEAPVKLLSLIAVASDASSTPTTPPAQWPRYSLEMPFSFEPFGALRALALTVQTDFEPDDPPATAFYSSQSPGLSYQPGDSLHLERMTYESFTKVIPREETLYQKLATLGDIEIGANVPVPRWPATAYNVQTNLQWLVVLKNGQFVDVSSLVGNVLQTLTRSSALHVVSFLPFNYTMAMGAQEPKWSVVAVSADGKRSADLADKCSVAEMTRWTCGATEFFEPTFEKFGWRSACGDSVEVTWTWNPTTGRYACTQRNMTAKMPKQKPIKKPKRAAQ